MFEQGPECSEEQSYGHNNQGAVRMQAQRP